MRGLYPPKITLKLFRIRTFTFKLPSFKSYVTPFGTAIGLLPDSRTLIVSVGCGEARFYRKSSARGSARCRFRDRRGADESTRTLVEHHGCHIYCCAYKSVWILFARARTFSEKLNCVLFLSAGPKLFLVSRKKFSKIRVTFCKKLEFFVRQNNKETRTHTRVAYK